LTLLATGLARGRRGGYSEPRTPRRPAHAHRPTCSARAACTPLQVSGRSAAHVWWYGWVTALSTGLGALPMVWYKNVSDWWLGVGNAIAAGMMTAASVALLSEGLDLPGSPRYGVACGVLTGVVFILGSQRIMERNDPNGDVKLAVLDVVDTRKARPPPARPTPGPAPACPALRAPGPTALRPPRASQALLLVLVMTLHSFSEGIGIGVSFGGQAGCPPPPSPRAAFT
jgi:ZIP family zinc transporter